MQEERGTIPSDLVRDPEFKKPLEQHAHLMVLEQAVISNKPHEDLVRLPGWVLLEGERLHDIDQSRESSPAVWRTAILKFVRHLCFVKTESILLKLADRVGRETALGSLLLDIALPWIDLADSREIFTHTYLPTQKLEKIISGKIGLFYTHNAGAHLGYIQLKEPKRLVTHHVKSVISADPVSVDQQIMAVEADHRKRMLIEPRSDLTWHKTTIIVYDETNPWPSSGLQEGARLHSPNHRYELLQVARYRIRRLTVGAEPIPGLSRSEEPSVQPDAEPIKIEGTSIAEATRFQLKCYEADHPLANTDIKEGKGVDGDDIASLIAARQEEEHLEDRCLVVTERVRIVLPNKDICITLDRTEGGYFLAHVKPMYGKLPAYRGAKPGQRQPRRPWWTEDPNQVRGAQLLARYGMFRHEEAVSADGKAEAEAATPESTTHSVSPKSDV